MDLNVKVHSLKIKKRILRIPLSIELVFGVVPLNVLLSMVPFSPFLDV